jgi:hypothetical protein
MMIAIRRMVCAMVQMARAQGDLLRETMAVLDRAMIDRRVRRPFLRGATFIDRVCKDSVVDHRHLRGAMVAMAVKMAATPVQISLAATLGAGRLWHATISADRRAMDSETDRASPGRIAMTAQVATASDHVLSAADQDRWQIVGFRGEDPTQ